MQPHKAADALQLADADKIKVKWRRLYENTQLLTPLISATIPVVLASNAPINTIPATEKTAIRTPTNVSS